MATEKIMLGINLRQNKNAKSTSFGKYYPVVDVQKTLSLRGFAEHMTEHNSYYPRNIVEGVLNQIVVCLPELLAQGVPVKFGSLGTFYPTAEVTRDGAIADIASMEGLSPSDVVKAIHIRFLPDRTKLDSLCGPAFKEACSMEFRNIVDTQSVTIGGKERKVQTLKPISTAVAQWKAGDEGGASPDNNNGGGASPDPSEGGGNNGGGTGTIDTGGGASTNPSQGTVSPDPSGDDGNDGGD